jgi:hypothetical protein
MKRRGVPSGSGRVKEFRGGNRITTSKAAIAVCYFGKPAPHNRLRSRARARKKLLAKQCWLGTLLVTERFLGLGRTPRRS